MCACGLDDGSVNCEGVGSKNYAPLQQSVPLAARFHCMCVCVSFFFVSINMGFMYPFIYVYIYYACSGGRGIVSVCVCVFVVMWFIIFSVTIVYKLYHSPELNLLIHL